MDALLQSMVVWSGNGVVSRMLPIAPEKATFHALQAHCKKPEEGACLLRGFAEPTVLICNVYRPSNTLALQMLLLQSRACLTCDVLMLAR